MTTIIARASSESGHWYGMDGTPAYTVTAKDGNKRPTTLRDARKLLLVPSVTTVMKVMAKPGLDVWKQEQLLLACLTLPRFANESEKDYIKRIIFDSKETGKQAAELGTRIHESIERSYNGESNVEHESIAVAFTEAVAKSFGMPKWNTENSFSAPAGYGGKIDLYTGISEIAPTGIVLDAKTKDFAIGDKIDAYDEMLMQLSAYRMGLNLPNARCANVFASRTNPGAIYIHEWSQEDLHRGDNMFLTLLSFWKLKNNFGIEK